MSLPNTRLKLAALFFYGLSAGAPSGVTLEVTITPTPAGNRITCGPARPDSSRQQGVAPRGQADSLEGTAR